MYEHREGVKAGVWGHRTGTAQRSAGSQCDTLELGHGIRICVRGGVRPRFEVVM